MNFESDYKKLVQEVILNGAIREGRNGQIVSKFAETITIDPTHLPILVGRKMFWKGVVGELAAMLEGADNVAVFKKYGCNYWDSWADVGSGHIELDYGTAWRNFNGIDQLAALIEGLRNDPNGRRHIITGWRPDRLADLSLPCCHLLYQWYVTNDGKLDMIWYQRSVDLMVGLPSDAIFAYVFNQLVAQTVGLRPGKITMMLGDCHVYSNHILNALKYLQTDIGAAYPGNLWIDPAATVFNFNPKDHAIVSGYFPNEAIEFKLNV